MLVAFELGDGQADGGDEKGTYVELGVAPGYSGSKASVAFPIKVGLSAKDYYEFGTGSDSKFGYFSVAGIVTVPINSHWNVHGGVELQLFGDNLRTYNGFGDYGRSPLYRNRVHRRRLLVLGWPRPPTRSYETNNEHQARRSSPRGCRRARCQ